MKRAFLVAALAIGLCAPAVAQTVAPWPTGLYSNVTSSAETGDLGGLEVRFYEDAGRHMAEFVLCEDWCNETHVVEVVRGDKGFVFRIMEKFEGANGPAPVELRFVVWPVRGGLAYSTYQGGEKIDWNGKPGLIRRAWKPFGIAVAKSGKE